MSAATKRAPTRRELVFRLATATCLSGADVSRTLDGERVGHHALQRVMLAAEALGVDLPPPPTPSAAVARSALLGAVTSHRTSRRGKGSTERNRARYAARLAARGAPAQGAAR